VDKEVGRDLKPVKNFVLRLHGISVRMVLCSNETVLDTFECVAPFIDYDCTKWIDYACGPVYEPMTITLNRLMKIEKFYDFYLEQFKSVELAMKLAENTIFHWTDLLEKCVVEE
jgi:hypothetical protein